MRQAVKESFQLWQDEIANLDFEECPNCDENGDKEADIKIYFNKWKLIVSKIKWFCVVGNVPNILTGAAALRGR